MQGGLVTQTEGLSDLGWGVTLAEDLYHWGETNPCAIIYALAFILKLTEITDDAVEEDVSVVQDCHDPTGVGTSKENHFQGISQWDMGK